MTTGDREKLLLEFFSAPVKVGRVSALFSGEDDAWRGVFVFRVGADPCDVAFGAGLDEWKAECAGAFGERDDDREAPGGVRFEWSSGPGEDRLVVEIDAAQPVAAIGFALVIPVGV